VALIVTTDQLQEMVDHYSKVDAFAFDVETIGDDRLDPHIAEVVWISFATEDRSDVIPMGHPNGELISEGPALLKSGEVKVATGKPLRPSDYSKVKVTREWAPPPLQLDRGVVFTALAPLFSGPALKVGHNIRFDIHAVTKYLGGERPSGPYFDTLVVSWLLDVTRKGRLGLADCYQRETGRVLEKGVGKDISIHSFDDVANYSLADARATWAVMKSLKRQIPPNSKLSRLVDLEMLVLHPVLEMEATGVLIDRDKLSDIDKELRAKLSFLEKEIFKGAGREFNVRSNKDKQEVLYAPKSAGGQGLKPYQLTPSGEEKAPYQRTIYDYSTDSSTLERYREKSKLVDSMLKHSASSKLHGTYVLPYLGGYPEGGSTGVRAKYVPSRLRKGRIYGSFLQFGTESGRFSSANPNLQNIPSRTDDGKKLREIFIPDPGHTLVVADYSQIEPRIIASLSGDKLMVSTYRDGGDVYLVVADRMGESRATGKELVLSIAYGVGVPTIANRLGITLSEAKELLDFFNSRFPSIRRHKQKVITTARLNKYSETLMGRRRPLPKLFWDDEEARSSAERQAYNHVIQGSAADIMKIALVNVHAELPEGARMLLTVHDEVVVQAPDHLVEETIEVVRREMEGARPRGLNVPLLADVHSGPNWRAAKG
jgi:DNA polymerase-1